MLLLLACTAPPDPAPPVADAAPVDVATPDDGWLRGDLHFHTNYSDDALEQGGDWMGPALDIADAWGDPAWQAFTGAAPTDRLDFVAVTDHRTDAGWTDPDFAHERLVVLPGEEFGSDGHAGAWGHDAHVPHEPQAGESADDRIADAIDEVHAQGGLFSANHPMYDGDLWGWSATGLDAVEVWNGPWAAMSAPTTPEVVEAWVASHGAENPWVRAGAAATGVTQNGQALRFWQAMLSDGLHVPPVGGGDRHMIFPAGLPTTYVAASEASVAGVLAGIASGSTFVSRSPQGPQVVLRAGDVPMGGEVAAGEVEISWVVGRAAGGELRFVAGGPGEEPAVVETIALSTGEEAGTWTWTASSGQWVHAVVVDPLPTDIPDDRQPFADALLTFPEDGGLASLLASVGALVDLEVLADPSECDPEDWDTWSGCCMPADAEPYATFYLADPVTRLLSAEFADGEATGWSMGAVSAAFWAR